MQARSECLDAVMRLKMVVLGLEGAEEALDHRVVLTALVGDIRVAARAPRVGQLLFTIVR